jgi:RNA polymerase sigma-70 factor, ECF subfamily
MQKNEINAQMITLIKKGDHKAFGIIFKSLYSSLVYFANAYIHDREFSKNIVQTVFMKLWEKRNTLKESENLKSYLYTITRNECISHLRHLKVSQRFQTLNPTFTEDLDLNIGALNQLDFDKIDLDNIRRIVEQTLENMPERCREVFILSRYDQLKYHEISDKLQISVKAVESNITRALKLLRENLKDYLPLGILQLIIFH